MRDVDAPPRGIENKEKQTQADLRPRAGRRAARQVLPKRHAAARKRSTTKAARGAARAARAARSATTARAPVRLRARQVRGAHLRGRAGQVGSALRARPDDGSGRRTKAAWEALLAKYDPTPLASCVHTLGQLARYYSTHARRVDLLEGWRQGLTKWEKMMNSMAVWVLKMIVEEGDRADFLADVIGYILICWCDSAAPRRRRGR